MSSTVEFDDSNMALFGTDVEKSLKYKNAENEPEWHKIPKEPTTLIWRIEKFCVVPWPKNKYGSFYNGDTYIILNITKEGQNLEYTAFMWVGINTSKDEAGTGAYKIVELDDFFHGGCELVYEAQGLETEQFNELFKEISILEGGIESGFRKVVEQEYPVRLLKVLGGKGLKTEALPLLVSVLTKEDAYILDAGKEIYAWRGENAGGFKKFNSAQILSNLSSSRGGNVKTKNFDEGDTGTKAVIEKYLKVDDGENRVIKLRSGRRKPRPSKKMFRLSDESGKLEMTEVNFSKDSLESKDAFLIDNLNEIYVWIGKDASPKEKKMGLFYAKKYMETSKVNIDCAIVITKEGSKKFPLEEIFELNSN